MDGPGEAWIQALGERLTGRDLDVFVTWDREGP